ncbi:MAG: NfeD family protein [Prevotella sp.]|jgi:membrane protein implicated in regulation of membrane protease activity|nr:NfeD family protein [Prevotella sp.]
MIEYISQNLWQFWAVIAVVCMILELTSGDFFILCFAIGGAVAAIIAPFSSFYVQLAVFAVVSVVSIFTFRPLALRWFHRNDPDRVSNADALIGREGKVREAIPEGDYGRVAIDGDVWRAKSQDGASVAEGETVVVIARESTLLTVERKQ